MVFVYVWFRVVLRSSTRPLRSHCCQ